MKKSFLLISLLSLLALVACPNRTTQQPTVDAAIAIATATSTAAATAAPAAAPDLPLRKVPTDTRTAPKPRLTLDPAFAHFAAQSTFVFRPNGVPGGVVYPAWVDVAQAVKLSPGPRAILVDNSLAPAHMTAGGPYDLDNVVLLGNESASSTLIIDNGATITSKNLTIQDGLVVQNQSTSVVWTPTQFSVLKVQFASNLQSAGGAAVFMAVTAASDFSNVIVDINSSIGDGTHNVISVDTSHQVIVDDVLGTVLAHAISGTGTAVIAQLAPVKNTQDVTTTTYIASTRGDLVGYSPTTAGNWNPVPSLVSQSLDKLAAPNVFGATSTLGAGAPSPASFAPSGTLTRAMSGKIRVSTQLSGTASAAGTITIQLIRDITTIAQSEAPVLAGGAFAVGVDVVDTLSDTSAHGYSFLATNSGGGTMTGLTNGEYLWASELP